MSDEGTGAARALPRMPAPPRATKTRKPRADKGVNILSYQVIRGDRAVSRLSGVVIRNPGQFVTLVPPINPLLVRLIEAPGGV